MEVLNDTAKLSDRHYSRMDQQDGDFNDTISRDLRRHEGVWVLSELTTRRRNEIQHYRRQDKIACYRNGRLQVEERRANPAVDSRKKRNSLTDTNGDPRYRRRDQERDWNMG